VHECLLRGIGKSPVSPHTGATKVPPEGGLGKAKLAENKAFK
jgi:hypothetical protein